MNAEGGIHGVPLEVIHTDFGYINLKNAASNAQKLVNVDKVDIILTQWAALMKDDCSNKWENSGLKEPL